MTPELQKTKAGNCDAQSGLSPAPLLGCVVGIFWLAWKWSGGDICWTIFAGICWTIGFALFLIGFALFVMALVEYKKSKQPNE